MKIALYPGSFDPITNGHLDVINRALKIFDKLTIAVSNAPKSTFFSQEERVEMVKKATEDLGVEVESFNGLLVDYAKEKNSNIIIILSF